MALARDADELPRLLLDAVPAMIAYWDSDLVCRFANLEYERWFGRSPAALRGRHISELLGPLYELNRPYLERALAGEPQEFARDIPAPDGGPVRHTLVVYVPDVVDGAVLGIFVLVSDVTELQRAKAALEEEIEQRKRLEKQQGFSAEIGPILASNLAYEQTLTRVAELAVRDLADLCIVEVVDDSDAMRRLKVAAADPAMGWVAEVLAREPHDRAHSYLLRSVLETRRTVRLERPSPEVIASFAQSEEHHRALVAADIQAMLAVPLVAHDRLLGAIALVSSSRSRVWSDAEVQMAEELARSAALSIANARLYREARRATQARDDVLGVVAHDLRNPLNGILMATGLLRRHGEPERRSQRPGDAIERAARRMNRLIEDLLDVTRMAAGRLSIEPSPIAAASIAADAVEAQRALAATASLELRLDAGGELPGVVGDRERLLQVFENLIGNAVKFTPAGGRVTVSAKSEAGAVEFSVSDTGPGIAPEDVTHLFDPFWQGKADGRKGAGLGLPIVKGIVEAHGGRVRVESVVGAGSTFHFTIPTAAGAAPTRDG